VEVVMRALFVIAVLTAPVHADPGEEISMSEDAIRWRNELGASQTALSIGFGNLAVNPHEHRTLYEVGLSRSVGLVGGLRGFADLDLVWLDKNLDSVRDIHGYGVRAELGLRHALATWRILYADIEAGGGVVSFADSTLGDRTVPEGYVALRLGYDMLSNRDRWFEPSFDFRWIEYAGGFGWTFGITIGMGSR
jgi:hypothetical protein